MIARPEFGTTVVLVSTLLLTGCATVTRGSHEMFSIASTPAGAQAYLSSGDSCVTPCQLRMHRGDPFRVRIAKPGYIGQTIAVQSKFSGMGGVGLLGNAVLGGLAGASVDSSSGAMNYLTPNPVSVILLPIPVLQADPVIAVAPTPPMAEPIQPSPAAALSPTPALAPVAQH